MRGQRVHAHILKENAQSSSDAILDVAVSFVSFTSLTGVVFAIAVDSGEVLEYHILSKEYRKCVLRKSQCKSDEEFEKWQSEHLT